MFSGTPPLRLLILTITLLIPIPIRAALPAVDSQQQPLPSLAPMLEQTVPAVVNIFTTTHVESQRHPLLSDPFFRRFFDLPTRPQKRQSQSLGSGVIIDAKEGYIITNSHVVKGADSIKVNLHDGRTVEAQLVGADTEADIAVIRVPVNSLTALPFANSDQLRVGDFVVAIGNPFGLGQTVTSGIVSALSRSGLGIEGYEDFIQTDASINPGNSGGALVNLRGELVGINTAILSESGGNVGIGFAIPVNMAREIMQQLVAYGEVKRGQLGIQAQDLTPELAQAFGVEGERGALVVSVQADSAAAKAGVRSGDVIVAVNGRRVDDATDVRNLVGLLRVGERITMQLLRGGRAQTVTAEIAEQAITRVNGKQLHPRLAGAEFGNAAEQPGATAESSGVVVLQVSGGSAAARAGLRPGDRITQANRQPVRDVATLAALLEGNGTQLLLGVQRGNQSLLLLMR